jgi:thiol-disulfide isomerase/thioredoxin
VSAWNEIAGSAIAIRGKKEQAMHTFFSAKYRTSTVIMLLIAAIILLCGGCRSELGTGGFTGQTSPDFTLTMLDGSELTLRELRGQPVLMEFWAPWCPGCKKISRY